jgi:hypothetical protein
LAREKRLRLIGNEEIRCIYGEHRELETETPGELRKGHFDAE